MGFRSLRLVSTSYMMKVDWSLRTKRDDLWVRIMRSKYKCGEDLLPIIDRKKMALIYGRVCAVAGGIFKKTLA